MQSRGNAESADGVAEIVLAVAETRARRTSTIRASESTSAPPAAAALRRQWPPATLRARTRSAPRAHDGRPRSDTQPAATTSRRRVRKSGRLPSDADFRSRDSRAATSGSGRAASRPRGRVHAETGRRSASRALHARQGSAGGGSRGPLDTREKGSAARPSRGSRAIGRTRGSDVWCRRGTGKPSITARAGLRNAWSSPGHTPHDERGDVVAAPALERDIHEPLRRGVDVGMTEQGWSGSSRGRAHRAARRCRAAARRRRRAAAR